MYIPAELMVLGGILAILLVGATTVKLTQLNRQISTHNSEMQSLRGKLNSAQQQLGWAQSERDDLRYKLSESGLQVENQRQWGQINKLTADLEAAAKAAKKADKDHTKALEALKADHAKEIQAHNTRYQELLDKLHLLETQEGITQYRTEIQQSVAAILGKQLDMFGNMRNFMQSVLLDILAGENDARQQMADLHLITHAGAEPPIIFNRSDIHGLYQQLMELLGTFAMIEDEGGAKVLQYENPLHDFASKMFERYQRAFALCDYREAYRLILQVIGAFKTAKRLEEIMANGTEQPQEEDQLAGIRRQYPQWFGEDGNLINFYETLGQNRYADLTALKKAYKAGAKLYHPDTVDSSIPLHERDERIRVLNMIDGVLQDDQLKPIYDAAYDTVYGVKEQV